MNTRSPKCPTLPVLHRSVLYRSNFAAIIEIIKSIRYRQGIAADCSDEIITLLEPIPPSYAQTVIPQFRTLLSHFIFHSPLLNECIFSLISKHSFLCGVASEQGNYPIHELMLAFHFSGKFNESIITAVMRHFPEALMVRNSNGDIPLHCLLSGDISGTSDNSTDHVVVLDMITTEAPDSARIANSADKLPLHLLLRWPETCPACLQLLVKIFPQGAVQEAVDEIIQLRISVDRTHADTDIAIDASTANATGSALPNGKRLVKWTPITRALDRGDYHLLQSMESALALWGCEQYQRRFMIA